MFAHTLAIWVEAIRETERGLLRDDLKLDGCDACPAAGSKPYTRWRDACDLNKAALRNGPLSYFAPFAKAAGCVEINQRTSCVETVAYAHIEVVEDSISTQAAGVALNFNCALLVLPVTRSVLILLNGLGGNYRAAQERSALFKKYFESPFARYVPLAKNVEFHKLVAWTMLALSLVHTVAHFFNYWASPRYTVARFAKWGWGGTSFVTGALVLVAMFFIFTAASDAVKRANFEVFWVAHHFFLLYYAALLLHGPVFYLWSLVPLAAYAYERRRRVVRGNAPFLVARVEWIPPVLAVHFRPADKRDFDFAEGTYVLLNCPFVSRHEWHPFTISSARGDLAAGARVALDDGETVVAVDPPAALPLRARARWRRYRRASADPATVCDDDLLAAHETAHHDFVSCHIKVHAAAPGEPPTWTQALKDYLEMMAPRRDYPFHFTRRDDRGELLLGRARGPDLGQILRVDGPHAAPAMHYDKYGSVLVVGAGIGMTPCASVLTAMLKYRWRAGFKPEILHFYWVVAHGDVPAFEWPPRDEPGALPRVFTARQLFDELLSPAVSSKDQAAAMAAGGAAPNRFQDTWVWNGRPQWDAIFEGVRAGRRHKDIGVCFCGTPVIGADLDRMCKKHSSTHDDCIFTLHKENF
ncbi:putative respiratory burst oxidase [Aureococcus anophagefferens]|uniref:Putative respiratory burst oxidase n=1 Tax=Aureococcus anophagefferens TaxID=44056 RepID=F0YK79_AURAN|nr:putative respiratory burst oxidase [Aureococcus anophagefferens]EGB04413.1 putative respiratory burst oxidase [Aureococcus anophagefferens]|eukprot:XP_009040800.1 putative respiratory burst oxidase [Aureococcus anophagefferens]